MDLSELLDALSEQAPSGPSEQPEAGELYFASITEADRALRGSDGRRGGGLFYRAVARYVLDPRNTVSGDADDYFNLVFRYSDFGDYHTALKLALHALRRYPYDVDLLSSAIRAASNCPDLEACEALLAQAGRVPRNAWSDRLFGAICTYYEMRLATCDQDARDEVTAAALDVVHEYQRYIPTDERAYDREAVFLLLNGRVADAQRVLEKAIFGMVELPDGEQASLVAPQCCVTMLDQVLKASTDYRLIAKVARRGVRNTAQGQPTANIGYFVYREALALDAIVCDASDYREGFRNAERVRETLVTYRCAYRLLEGRTYCSTIRDRYTLLCLKSGITDLPLEDTRE